MKEELSEESRLSLVNYRIIGQMKQCIYYDSDIVNDLYLQAEMFIEEITNIIK